MSDTKNDAAWEKLFEKYPILNNIQQYGFFEITSKQINEFREARLMTKFDVQRQLPRVFSENELAILPITRGSYIIGKFKIFEKIKNNKSLETIGIDRPLGIESIDIENISSETTALLCANICGIFNNFFDETQLTHTIGGRMGSGDFSFYISGLSIDVSKSQIEIDGGFESERYIYLVEVKNLIHEDFLIRQIYYPFKAWLNKLEEKRIAKKVRNIFLTYSDGLFYLREYEFQNKNDPTSIKIVNEAKYSIVKDSLSMEQLQHIVSSTEIIEDPELPFPQSDDIEKTINLCELLYYREQGMTKLQVTEEFGFVPRQAEYYGNSARYLGLVQYVDKEYTLTPIGEKIFSKPLKQRQFEIVKLILSREPFNIVMKYYLDKGHCPTKDEVKALTENCKLYGVGKNTSTFGRRCSTIISWINWILDRVEV